METVTWTGWPMVTAAIWNEMVEIAIRLLAGSAG
jgi:hypothetical protein